MISKSSHEIRAKSIVLLLCFLWNITGYSQVTTDFTTPIKSHYQKLITSGTDTYGEVKTPLWMASLDPVTGKYPEKDARPENIPQRVYLNRSVSAPKGSTAYWDFPNFAATDELSRLSGNPAFKASATQYLQSYIDKCKANNGVILWGNHYYYDSFADQCVKFNGSEKPHPVDFNTETGDLHEIRPFSPAWEILWEMDPVLTERHIRQAIMGHVVDTATGEFNRHADGKTGYAFIEAGGILSFSLAWLYHKTGDASLLVLADKIVNYSYSNRDLNSGLLENSPTQDRWDKYTSTTEIGLWANFVLKASRFVPHDYAIKWQTIISSTLARWLVNGWSEKSNLYFGGLNINDGTPYRPQPDYPYQPDEYADIFNPLFPTHNYPLQLAEATLSMFRTSRNQLFEDHAKNWLIHIKQQLMTRDTRQLMYAENYARIIHYLKSYHQTFKDQESKRWMLELAREAISRLYLEDAKMFRSHTGEIRYDAVDGVGLLALVLLEIEYDQDSKYGLYFF
ncbi:MAG: hypothetical protein ACFHWX_12795 [Bacteroidota bacterium]